MASVIGGFPLLPASLERDLSVFMLAKEGLLQWLCY